MFMSQCQMSFLYTQIRKKKQKKVNLVGKASKDECATTDGTPDYWLIDFQI